MALVVEYHEELEIDLHGQGVDLLDFWRGRLTPRRLEVLVSHLDPKTSATIRAVNPDAAELASWDATNYQLADVFDAIARANFQDPKPYPRPGPAIQERQRTEARHRALIERFEARQRKGATRA